MTDFKNSIHIVNTIFTGRGTIGNTTGGTREESEEWIQDRVYLFKKYALASLRNQTNQNFLHWVCFRTPHPAWEALSSYLKEIGYNFVFTYSGQCHFDDKGDNSDLERRTAKALEKLKPYVEGKEWVYYTHLDSDDMFTKDAFELIQAEEPEVGKSLVFQKGYAVNYTTKELADWFCVSPPFYTIIYPADDFIDAKKKGLYELGLNSHENALTVFKAKIMPDNKYSYLIHDNNKSTPWRHNFRGKVHTDQEERKEILKQLGI